MSEYQNLQSTLGYIFNDIFLLRQALTHPSYTAEKTRVNYDNQRLEFLGDAVLQLIVSDLLFKAHPEAPEGLLSNMRSLLAREAGLTRLARKLSLGGFIRLGRGEKLNRGHQRDSILADAMEAIFGAVYLDGGFNSAKSVIESLYQEVMEEIDKLATESNPKGTLQEISQEKFKLLPYYEIVEITGPEHEPQYKVQVSISDHTMAIGKAGNRREAEQEAARTALKILENKTNT